MVKIRLTRTGRKNYATYRIVITEAREKRDSKFIEFIGHYNPHTKDLQINEERAKYWISVGAQPTESVQRMLVKQNLVPAPAYKRTFKGQPGKKAKDRAKKAE